MVSRFAPLSFAALVALFGGCALANPSGDHVRNYGSDAGPSDVGIADGSADAGRSGPPRLRVVHLARDTGTIEVSGPSSIVTGLDFLGVSEQVDVPSGTVTFSVVEDGTALISETLGPLRDGVDYTLAFYGDVAMASATGRPLGLLLLEDDPSGLASTDIRLIVIHLATPVSAGQLVAVDGEVFTPLITDLDFPEVDAIDDLPAARYTVAFDIGADDILDVEFELPAYFPGTYANVFIGSRGDGSVFLFSVNARSGASTIIESMTP